MKLQRFCSLRATICPLGESYVPEAEPCLPEVNVLLEELAKLDLTLSQCSGSMDHLSDTCTEGGIEWNSTRGRTPLLHPLGGTESSAPRTD
ncbi:hypothetical protein CPT_Spernnie_026 [Streptomyces phage Spernnie]|uniref:Uncharacterized protein n=1 Tax=Streptomyces phage Spernnie TaxID=2767588 RepID=A0A873WE06_9CAUD|nr:hypothetical protein KGG74_gp26 [Streptomyces phage Spernnie]QPB09630.1 hypothetical protein CPT_Spernnie_026 [Streptomyces phage Spernnie]